MRVCLQRNICVRLQTPFRFLASSILPSFTSRENSFQAGECTPTLPINAVLPLQLRTNLWVGNAEEHGMDGWGISPQAEPNPQEPANQPGCGAVTAYCR